MSDSNQELEQRGNGEGGGGPARLRHPRGLFLLFVVEMWERFSYYGMRALLVLYMTSPTATGGIAWTEKEANQVYGWYTSLVWLMPLFGGMLADRLLGTHRSMVIGGVIIALGHFTLALIELFEPGSNEGLVPYFAGLALVIVGTGFFKPCVSVMVGQLYGEGDRRRDAGFTIFYMGINLGAFMGPLLCGWLAENPRFGWAYGFGAAGVGMLLGLVAYFLGRPILLRGVGLPPEKPNAAFAFKLLLGLAVATALLVGAYKGVESLAFEESEDGTAVLARPLLLWGLLGGIAAWAVIGIAWFVKIQDPEYRKPTLALFIICFFAIFFFYAFEQAGSSMNLFAEQRTATDTFAGFQDSPPFQWLLKEDGSYPSSWFQSVNPLYILLFAPVFAGLWGWLRRRGLEPSTAMKMVFGLFLLGSGFVFMMLAGYSTDGGRSLAEGEAPARVGPHWLLLAYMMHTFGELCLSPVGLSLVTKLAAERYVSLMMGVWFLSSAVAQLLAGYTAAAVKEIERGEVFAPVFGGQADFWLVFLVTSVAGGVALLALTPLMKRLMGGKG